LFYCCIRCSPSLWYLLFLFYCCIRCSCSLWYCYSCFIVVFVVLVYCGTVVLVLLFYSLFVFIVTLVVLVCIVVSVVSVHCGTFSSFHCCICCSCSLGTFFTFYCWFGDLLYKTIGYALFQVRFICFKHQHEYIETCNPDTRCFLGIDVVDIKWLLISYLFTLAWPGVHNYLVIIYV
jgi:hypothetical protein